MTDLTELVVPIRINLFPDEWPMGSWVNMTASCVASAGYWFGVAWAVAKGVALAL